MKTLLKLLLLLAALLVWAVAPAQSALDQARAMAGNASINIPPASPPACALCGHLLREGVGHYPGCSYYPRQSSSSSDSGEQYYNTGSDWNRQEPEHVVYVPPTPIRDTPEGQAMLAVAQELGYAMGSMVAEGLKDLISWGFDKIYDSTHKEYHGLGYGKQNRNFAVVEKKGKYGVWDNNRHRWQARPAFSSITINCLEAAPAQDAKTGKWGIYNVKEKKEVVPFQFDECKFFPKGGARDPVALGIRDAGGNMHWSVGNWSNYDENHFIKLYGEYSFDFWEGEFSAVELTHNSRGDLALLVKDYKTGKSGIRSASGSTFFWGTSNNGGMHYDEIQLTGMYGAQRDKAGNVTYYNDFYIVSNGGKKGYAMAVSAPDHKAVIDAYSLLPCVYDEITAVRPLAPDEVKSNHGDIFGHGGYEYLLVRKDGRYGVGADWSSSVKEPAYLSAVLLTTRNEKGARRHFFVVQREDGVFEALTPKGNTMYYSDGNTHVTGATTAEVVRNAEYYLQHPEVRSRHFID